MKNKKIIIYEYKNGKIKEDKIATFINNNTWTLWLMFLLMFIACGILESI